MLTAQTSLRVFFLVACVVLPIFTATSQVNIAEKKITLSLKGVPLHRAFELISEKSGISFSYNPKRLPTGAQVTLNVVNEPLGSVLKTITELHDLRFMLIENQIIIKEEKKKVMANSKPAVHTLSGYIKDSKTGEPLIGASVYVDPMRQGTTTNGFGFYSITLPAGTYTATYSYVGYSSNVQSLDLRMPIQNEIRMEEFAPMLAEVVVSTSSTEAADPLNEILSSKINIPATIAELKPSFFSEADVVKSLESIPGIQFHGDGSTFYYVRGGNRDQNLILLDDAPIYNPSHMLGVFSTIIPDAVNDVNLYKGDIPASLGGRLSSVLEVRTKKGNDQHLSAWGNFGLISTKLGIEGPFRKNFSSFLISTRISRLKWFFKRVTDDVNAFDFSDFTAKVNVRLNPANRILFSFYTGGDKYFSDNTGIEWRNNAGTLQWNHLFGDRIFLNTTLAASGYDYFLHTDVRTNTRWNAHVSNITLKNDLTYYINPSNDLSMGMAINGYGFNPGNLLSDNPIPPALTLSVRNASELVLYANHEARISEKLGVSYGLRFTSWATTGEAFEFKFNENHEPIDTLYFEAGENYKRYGNLEPRLNLRYSFNEITTLKAGYARNVQNIHLISNSTSPFTSLEVWLPSSINIRPQKANQFTIGLFRDLRKLGSTFSAEVFIKRMSNQIDFESHPETLLNPLIEGELRFGKGRARGLELMLRKDEGRVRGWIGYTFSRSRLTFDEINGEKTFNAFSDRPHQINLLASYDASVRWNLNLNWIYTTGAPYSAPSSYYNFNGQQIPIYADKNNARLPDYHRMDFSAVYKINRNPEKKYQHNISFSVFNLYGRKNPLFVNYNKTEDANGDLAVPSNLVEANRVTSEYYLFSVIPSISYNFKWR